MSNTGLCYSCRPTSATQPSNVRTGAMATHMPTHMSTPVCIQISAHMPVHMCLRIPVALHQGAMPTVPSDCDSKARGVLVVPTSSAGCRCGTVTTPPMLAPTAPSSSASTCMHSPTSRQGMRAHRLFGMRVGFLRMSSAWIWTCHYGVRVVWPARSRAGARHALTHVYKQDYTYAYAHDVSCIPSQMAPAGYEKKPSHWPCCPPACM